MTRAFAAAAADMLLDHGPLTLDELHALAVERGLTKSKNATSLRYALDCDDYVVRPDGRYDTAERLLRGQVFTTRPRPGERDGVLWTHRDLDPYHSLRRMPLADGGELRRGEGAVESWTGPSGWLPTTVAGELLALGWDGRAMHVSVVDDAPLCDSDVVRDVREVLSRHARSEHRYGLPSVPRASLTRTVLSALVEDPQLFATPLPPLREMLPLPEDLRPSDGEAGLDPGLLARIVEVPVAVRVHDELARRADLIGERLPDYLSMLLSAAADRVHLTPYQYDRYEPYPAPFTPQGGDVVRLDSWGR